MDKAEELVKRVMALKLEYKKEIEDVWLAVRSEPPNTLNLPDQVYTKFGEILKESLQLSPEDSTFVCWASLQKLRLPVVIDKIPHWDEVSNYIGPYVRASMQESREGERTALREARFAQMTNET